MSGNLGELVIEIAANMSRFQNDMRQANVVANNTMQKMQGDVSRSIAAIEGAFKTFSVVAAGVGTVLAGGALFGSAVSTANAVAGEVGKLSRSLGITAQQASVLRIALDDAFLSAEDMQAGANRITKQLLSNEDAFKKLGVATRDSNGHYRNTVDIMMETNSALSKLKAGTDQNVAGMSVYGKSWGEVRGLLKLNSEAMKEARERAEELNLIVGPEQVAASRQYKLAMKDIEDVNESLKVQIGKELIPVLTSLAVEFGKAGAAGAGLFARELRESERSIAEFELSVSTVMRKLGIVMNGGPLGANWLTKSGRAEIKAELDAQEQMWKYSLERISEKYGTANKAIQRAPAKGAQIDPDVLRKSSDAAEKMRSEYNQGVQAYNRLVDTFNGSLGTLSATEQAIAKVREEVAKLSKGHPEQAADAQRLGKKIEDQLRLADAIKIQNAEVRESIRLMEEMNKEWELSGLTRGLSTDALRAPAAKGSMPKFSLTGASETGGYFGQPTSGAPLQIGDALVQSQAREFQEIMAAGNAYQEQMLQIDTQRKGWVDKIESWNDAEVGMAEKKVAALIKVEQDYAEAKQRIDFETSRASADSLQNSMGQISNILMEGSKEQFEIGKRIAQTLIAIDTAKATSAAFAGAAAAGGPWGVALGIAAGAAAMAAGAMNMARLESIQYQARELGGPVRAGETYLIGEKGPELMTFGASGHITSNRDMTRMGGQGANVTNVFQVSAGVAATAQAEIMRAVPYIVQQSVAAVRQAIDGGGSLAQSVGRRP